MTDESVNVNENEVSPYPSDGYFVEEFDSAVDPKARTLVLSYRKWGRVQSIQTVGQWQNPTEEGLGERRRLFWLWKAICHFLNSGGNIDVALDPIVNRDVVNGVALSAQIPPPGYFLYDTDHEVDINGEVHTEHVFVNREEEKAIHWIEGVKLEVVPLSEVVDWESHLPRKVQMRSGDG